MSHLTFSKLKANIQNYCFYTSLLQNRMYRGVKPNTDDEYVSFFFFNQPCSSFSSSLPQFSHKYGTLFLVLFCPFNYIFKKHSSIFKRYQSGFFILIESNLPPCQQPFFRP